MIFFNCRAKTTCLGKYSIAIILFLVSAGSAFPQNGDSVKTTDTKTVIAGKQYDRSGLHQLLWGKHYRKDWATPVQVKTINLDTVNGGLVAYEKGGGRQSKTLRLRNAAGKEYVLRSIDKSFGKALPDIYRDMFIEDIVNDQVSIAEPYSAITIPLMAKAAGIYHTTPQIVFVPSQKALGEFDKEFGNDLYLFEQRPDENWEEAANFANSNKIVGTDKLLEKLFEDSDNRVDQLQFVRSRLFDMFIGDWGRHDDQWRWAKIEDGDKNIYQPIPRDRDQAYTKFDGLLLSLGLSAADAGHLQTFGTDIKDVGTYNFPARNLDRQMANEPTKEQWIAIAKDLQQTLTDNIIEESIKKLPPEVFPLSGNDIITKLKARRDKLVEFATEYYSFLAKEVEIVGTKDNEFLEVKSISDTETEVTLYDLNKEGTPKNKPFYTRRFFSNETSELRIYGLDGNDRYSINTVSGNPTKVRIIGGQGNDNYTTAANATGKVHIYDNPGNDFSALSGARKHLADSPYINKYVYNAFKYDKKGLGLIASFNNKDRAHVGLKYKIEKQQWRKTPFGQQQELAARYSISEGAFSFGYKGIFTELVGKWNLLLNAEYDLVRWNNYYGIGNETKMLTNNRNFHRVRSKEFYAGAGIQRTFARYHNIEFTTYYQTIEILNDPGRFITKETSQFKGFAPSKYGGGLVEYNFQKLDNVVVPMKGVRFEAGVNHMQNLNHSDSTVTNFSGALNIYIPLSKSFVFATRTGGATLSGKPAFYQLNKLSGSKTLRGFSRFRFYGESMFYNQAELQFIKDVKSYLFSGKAGLVGFYDLGRVWQPGESSNTWHYGYGGGIMLSPFNRLSVAVFYGISRNEKDFSFRLIQGL